MKTKTVKNNQEAAIVVDTVLCVGDSCTTHWKGNGQMIVLGLHWNNVTKLCPVGL